MNLSIATIPGDGIGPEVIAQTITVLEKIATKLTAYMIDQKIVPEEDEEIYVYGWSLIFSHVGSFLVMLIAAALMGEVLGTLIFLVFMIPLRSYAGGFHADSYLKCFILSMSCYAIALIAALFWPSHFPIWTLALALFAVLATFIAAPVDHPNKRLKEFRRRQHKIISRVIVLVQAILISGFWFLLPGLRHYLLWAMLGMAMTSISLLYVVIRPYKEVDSD